jgi:predicted amidohydrolase
MVRLILVQALPGVHLESLENLDRALRLLEKCLGQGADLICLPEYFPFAGEEELARAARSLEAYLVAGLVETQGGERYNTATLFDRQGNLVGRQRKHNLGDLERRGFGVVPGDGWQVWETDFGRLGLAVCIDFWGQPEAARRLSALGADLVVNPSIFPILRGHWRYGALVRAFDYFLPVAAVNSAGAKVEIAGRQYRMQGGRSFAVQPPAPADEREMARLVRGWDDLSHWVTVSGGEEEELLACTLDLAGARLWRPFIHRRFGIRPASGDENQR